MTQLDRLTAQLGSRLEMHEAQWWGNSYRAASPDVVRNCGLSWYKVGSASLNIAAKIDILAFNRVIGLGICEPATAKQIRELKARYEQAGVARFFVQLSPLAAPAELHYWLLDYGFRHHNNWVKLFRRVEHLPIDQGDYQIDQIDRARAATFAEIIVSCFGWLQALEPMIAGTVGLPGWKHYLAYDNDQPIACAAAYLAGEMSALALAATLPEYRGRGSQSALIARRMRDAAKAGCQWVTVETAVNKPESPSSSYRNLRRLGFEVAYLRPNYIYEFGSSRN